MNLDAQVKNKFNISEILKKLLLRVNKLENTSSDKLIYAQRSYVDRANSYTINETLTGGTWIDGKPIYRKVIQFTLLDGVFESDLTSLNIEHCLKCSANLLDYNHQSINEQLLVLRDAVSQFYSRVTFPNLLEVAYMMTKITTGETSFNNVEMSGSVILEYTKTTD